MTSPALDAYNPNKPYFNGNMGGGNGNMGGGGMGGDSYATPNLSQVLYYAQA